MSFSISTSQAISYYMAADGKQNPYSSTKVKKDGAISENELAKHLVDLQNGAGGSDRALKGALTQTTLVGNEGKGFFKLIAELDGASDKIEKQDIKKLAALDGNPDDVTAKDFKLLKSMPKKQKPAQKPATPFMQGTPPVPSKFNEKLLDLANKIFAQ